MSAFARYMHAQSETKAAYAQYNHAAVALELAQIRERLAMIESQHEPLATLNPEGNSVARKKQIGVAYFVVNGRWPEQEKP